MNAIKIIHATPLSRTVLLVVVEDSVNEKRDVILLSNICKDSLSQDYIENLEKIILWPDDIQSNKKCIDVTFEIEEFLFDKVNQWCRNFSISIEQLVLAFIHFCACKNNHVAFKEWFSINSILNELASTTDELLRVRAELLKIKQRFGLDKQEAFLKANKDITLKEFALMLNGRDCQPDLTENELLLAKKRGFVVVYGDSDDRVEFVGAIREEGYTNPMVKDSPAGVLVLSEEGKLIDEDCELYTENIRINRNVINVYYYGETRIPWTFETKIPHEIFSTYDGGYDDELENDWDEYQRCIVFELSALSTPCHIISDN
ncbi:MAG: hypothetical protein LBC73_02970 [Oscillospiraceae bacterium]|jgi:hypothetical protein|nr:hypothetical protein [Oscillospiraceae bacterium]